MVFMSASRSASGNCFRKAGTTFETPSFLSSGVPISTMLIPPANAAPATARPCAMVATSTEIWNVKPVLSRSITRAEAGWVSFAACSAQAELGRIELEECAGRQPADGELPRAVEERTPVDAPVLMSVNGIWQVLREWDVCLRSMIAAPRGRG